MEHQPYLGVGETGRGVVPAVTLLHALRISKSPEVLLAAWLVPAPDILGDGVVSVPTNTARAELGGQSQASWEPQSSTLDNLVKLLHEGEEIFVSVNVTVVFIISSDIRNKWIQLFRQRQLLFLCILAKPGLAKTILIVHIRYLILL